MSNGNHTYKVVAFNAAGQSEAAEKTAFVGVDVPGAVTNLKYTYDYESHTSTITWDAPTVGANGGYINPDALTYNVRRFRQTDPLVTGMNGYSYEDEVTYIDNIRIIDQRGNDLSVAISSLPEYDLFVVFVNLHACRNVSAGCM